MSRLILCVLAATALATSMVLANHHPGGKCLRHSECRRFPLFNPGDDHRS